MQSTPSSMSHWPNLVQYPDRLLSGTRDIIPRLQLRADRRCGLLVIRTQHFCALSVPELLLLLRRFLPHGELFTNLVIDVNLSRNEFDITTWSSHCTHAVRYDVSLLAFHPSWNSCHEVSRTIVTTIVTSFWRSPVLHRESTLQRARHAPASVDGFHDLGKMGEWVDGAHLDSYWKSHVRR